MRRKSIASGPLRQSSKPKIAAKYQYATDLSNHLMNDEVIQRELLINQRRKSHTCWAFIFFFLTMFLGVSAALPGFQGFDSFILSVYPGVGENNAKWVTSFLTILSSIFCISSTFFACRSTPRLEKMQSTDNPEDAYRASLLGLGVSKDAQLNGIARGTVPLSGSSVFNERNHSLSSFSTSASAPSLVASTSSPSSTRRKNVRGMVITPGSSGRSRNSSRGRQSSGRRSDCPSIQSPISRLVSGFNGVRQWSTDRAREVASMSPIGRNLDVDLLDRRTGIDSEEMLKRYTEAFDQQRQVQQQRGGLRSALDPNAQAGRINQRVDQYQSRPRKRSTPSSSSNNKTLSKQQLEEQTATAEYQYIKLGIVDYIDNWQSNLRRVFARELIKCFITPYERSNQDLMKKGVDKGLLEHTKDTQVDFSNMCRKLKDSAESYYRERKFKIKDPNNNNKSQALATRELAEAERLHEDLLDRLDSNFQDFNNLDLRLFLYRCSDQVKAYKRRRKEKTYGSRNLRSSSNMSNQSSGGGLPNLFGDGGSSSLIPGGSSLLPTQNPGMMMGANGVPQPTTNMFQTTVTTDYERLFYVFFLSPRRDPISNQLVNLIEERERLEKYLLVPSRIPGIRGKSYQSEQSRGYVLKRIRELTNDRRFGDMNWKGGGIPNDVEIVLHFFFAHVELQLRVKGFAAKYKLTGDDLEKRHSVGDDVYIVERNTIKGSSHVQVICKGKEYAVRSGRDNVFEALTLFLYFVHTEYQGMLENVDLYEHLCLDEVFDDNRVLGGLMTM